MLNRQFNRQYVKKLLRMSLVSLEAVAKISQQQEYSIEKRLKICRLNGAYVHVEHKLNHGLLYLSCRHYIYEVLLQFNFDEEEVLQYGHI